MFGRFYNIFFAENTIGCNKFIIIRNQALREKKIGAQRNRKSPCCDQLPSPSHADRFKGRVMF